MLFFPVSEPSCHSTSGIPLLILLILFRDDTFFLCVLAHLCYNSIGDTDKLCLRDRLSCCCYEVRALVDPLSEVLKGFLHVVWGSETLIIGRRVRVGDEVIGSV